MSKTPVDVNETTHQYHNPYHLAAEEVAIEARRDGAAATLSLTAGSPGGNDGTVAVVGNKQVSIHAGKDGKTQALAGDDAFSVVHGDVTNLAQLVLSGEALQLRKGLPVGGLDNSLKITDDAIELKCGPLTTIKMTKTGITLSCGPTSIQMSPQGLEINGINIEVAASLLLKLKSTLCDVDTKAVNKLGAVFNKIG